MLKCKKLVLISERNEHMDDWEHQYQDDVIQFISIPQSYATEYQTESEIHCFLCNAIRHY